MNGKTARSIFPFPRTRDWRERVSKSILRSGSVRFCSVPRQSLPRTQNRFWHFVPGSSLTLAPSRPRHFILLAPSDPLYQMLISSDQKKKISCEFYTKDAWTEFTKLAFADCSHAIFIIREHGFENTSWPDRIKQYFDMIKRDMLRQQNQGWNQKINEALA